MKKTHFNAPSTDAAAAAAAAAAATAAGRQPSIYTLKGSKYGTQMT